MRLAYQSAMREDETLNTPDGHPLLESGSVAPCEQCGGKAGERTIHLPLELPHIPDVIRPLMSPLSPGRGSPRPPPDFARMVSCGLLGPDIAHDCPSRAGSE